MAQHPIRAVHLRKPLHIAITFDGRFILPASALPVIPRSRLGTLSTQRPVLAVLAITLLCLLALKIGSAATGNPDGNTGSVAASYIIPAIVAVALAFASGLTRLFSTQLERRGAALRTLWPVLLVGGLFIAANVIFMKSPTAAQTDGAGTRLLWLIVIMALTAFVEETFFRGVALNILLGSRRFTAFSAVMLTAGLFAISHLANLIRAPHLLVSTGSQVIYAFALGIFFGAVYLRSGSLWVPVIGHWLFNTLASATSIFQLPGSQETDIPLIAAALQLALVSPLFVIGWRWLRTLSAADVGRLS